MVLFAQLGVGIDYAYSFIATVIEAFNNTNFITKLLSSAISEACSLEH